MDSVSNRDDDITDDPSYWDPANPESPYYNAGVADVSDLDDPIDAVSGTSTQNPQIAVEENIETEQHQHRHRRMMRAEEAFNRNLIISTQNSSDSSGV